jgi:dUTP pyrophosphatase
MLIEYAALHENVFHPQRANPSDVGLDIFFSPDVPFNTHDHVKNMTAGSMVILPNQNAKLRTGLSFAIPHGFCAEIKNRSSVSSKQELLVGGGVIDPGYSGEIVVIMHNVGKVPRIIYPGDKIAQLVVYPVIHVRPISVEVEQLYKDNIAISNRGSAGFGSTDLMKREIK